MPTFILRARKGKTRWDQLQPGDDAHTEIIAHAIINAFFISRGFRTDVTFHLVLDSSADFPRTITLSGAEGLSLPGFHEQAVLDVIRDALRDSTALKKDETLKVAPGVKVSGFGFEKLLAQLMPTRQVYLLDPKGDDIMTTAMDEEAVFILSDHLALPKNIVKSLSRRGLRTISLGRQMLFASQCIVLIHAALARKA